MMRRTCKIVPALYLLLLAGCASVQSISNPHGPAARSIAHLSIAMSITFLITTLIMWVLLTVAFKKRRGSLDEHMPIEIGGGQAWIAIGGLAVPLLVLSVFFFLGLELLSDFPIHGKHGMQGMNGMDRMDEAANMPKPDIVIVGHQWWWEVRYFEGNESQLFTTANEIHIPTHRPVNIELLSNNVQHSFWVPALHGKVDLVPGHANYIRIEASQPGNYAGQCAEFCGEQHALMRILVVAQEPAAFAAWLAQQQQTGVKPTTSGTIQGEQAFLAGPCSQCHAVRGTAAHGQIAPDLTHVGSRQYIGANSFRNDNAILEAWITHAQSLKQGCKMPDITQYTGMQLRQVTSYLRQLQ